MNKYELSQWIEIQSWEQEKPGVISKVSNTLLHPVTWIAEKVIPQKLIESALISCNAIASTLTDKDDIIRDGEVSTIDELKHKSLELSDKLANSVHNWAITTASAEGAAAGASGVAGIAIDIPATITMAYRVIHKIGLCYGFECNSEIDKQFVNAVIAASTPNTVKEKSIALVTLKQIEVIIAKNTWKKISEKAITSRLSKEAAIITTKQLAKQVGKNITKKKAMQAIPVISAGIGAALTASFIRDVGWTARRCFQRRWLLENQLIQIEENI